MTDKIWPHAGLSYEEMAERHTNLAYKFAQLRARYIEAMLWAHDIEVDDYEIREDGDDILVVDPCRYAADEDCPDAEEHYAAGFENATAEEIARAYASDSAWGDSDDETSWVRVCVYRKAWRIDTDNDVTEERVDEETVKVAIDPDEPECADNGRHEWCAPHEVVGGMKENPGVWGSGGGVKTARVCKRCGLYRHVNTWAQDRSDGEQGLTSVRYEDADRYSLAWVKSFEDEEANDE